jgi:hypothetical protein
LFESFATDSFADLSKRRALSIRQFEPRWQLSQLEFFMRASIITSMLSIRSNILTTRARQHPDHDEHLWQGHDGQ